MGGLWGWGGGGGTFGSSVDNSTNVKSVILAKCTNSTQGHLRYCNIRDATLDSEAKLLLARAGMFSCVYVCPTEIDVEIDALLYFQN